MKKTPFESQVLDQLYDHPDLHQSIILLRDEYYIPIEFLAQLAKQIHDYAIESVDDLYSIESEF
jgi:hypothetical protein